MRASRAISCGMSDDDGDGGDGFLYREASDATESLLDCARYNDSGDAAALFARLSAAPALLDARDAQGRTAVHMAAANGHVGLLARLMEFGPQPDVPNGEGHTALHFAAMNGQTEAARVLLRNGWRASARSADGKTPIQLIYNRGMEEMEALLLEQDDSLERYETRAVAEPEEESNAEAENKAEGENKAEAENKIEVENKTEAENNAEEENKAEAEVLCEKETTQTKESGKSTPAMTQAQLMKVARFEDGSRGREHCCFATPHLYSEHGVDTIDAGWFYTPSVKELREELQDELQRFESERPGYLDLVRYKFRPKPDFSLSHDIGDSASLHRDQPGALFQAASQFNLLEFPHSSCVPEMGIGPYVYDKTQGPACAVACAGATAYRCYLLASRFVRGADGEQRGQSTDHQADMLRDVTRAITDGAPGGISRLPYSEFYTVRNGYFSSTSEQMVKLMERIGDVGKSRGLSRDDFLDELSSLLRIGVVEDTTVTAPLHVRGNQTILTHKVTQTFNSALSLNQRYPSGSPWEIFAKMVLVGSYEATLLCGALHTLKYMRKCPPGGPLPSALPPIYLTKVGGGVFLNDPSWIRHAIQTACRSIEKYDVPMNVRLVHFRYIEESYMS